MTLLKHQLLLCFGDIVRLKADHLFSEPFINSEQFSLLRLKLIDRPNC